MFKVTLVFVEFLWHCLDIDGAYFGTTFPHLFLMTYGHLKPQKAMQSYVPRVFGFKLHKPWHGVSSCMKFVRGPMVDSSYFASCVFQVQQLLTSVGEGAASDSGKITISFKWECLKCDMGHRLTYLNFICQFNRAFVSFSFLLFFHELENYFKVFCIVVFSASTPFFYDHRAILLQLPIVLSRFFILIAICRPCERYGLFVVILIPCLQVLLVYLFVVYVKEKRSGHRISSRNSENDLIWGQRVKKFPTAYYSTYLSTTSKRLIYIWTW